MGFSLSSSKQAGAAGPARTRVMVLIGVIGLGVIGWKLFWPEGTPLRASAGKLSSMIKKPPTAGSTAVKPRTKPTDTPHVAAKPTPKPKPAVAKPVVEPEDTDIPTPDEISKAPKQIPATRPAPAPLNDVLGPVFVDENNGFAMRFPAGWAIRSFIGEPWVLDCGDGKVGLVSVGFSPFPADFTADNIPPEWVARRIKKRNDTTLHAQGFAMIAGKKALWSKSTGPLPMTNGNPRMTRVNYIVPLGDGRVMELRIASTPEMFDQLMPAMRAAVESFKFLPRSTTATH